MTPFKKVGTGLFKARLPHKKPSCYNFWQPAGTMVAPIEARKDPFHEEYIHS